MTTPDYHLKTERRSIPILTKYERSTVLGKRAEQISITGKTYLEDQSLVQMRAPEEIAMMELNRRLIPYTISRRMPDGSYEYFDIRELDLNY